MTTVILGAAGGMGSAVARRMATQGPVLLSDLHEEPLDRLVGELREGGFDARGIAGDAADPALSARLADAVEGSFGGLVNAAGAWHPDLTATESFAVNYLPTTHLLDAFVGLAGAGSAAVIIASTGGHRRGHAAETDDILRLHRGPDAWPAVRKHWGDALDAHTAYGIAKRGVILECELRNAAWTDRGARLVSISPGNFATPMGRRGAQRGGANFLVETAIGRRPGAPDEIADLVEFLLSPRASYLSGCDIRIDGGALASSRHARGSAAFDVYDAQLVPRR